MNQGGVHFRIKLKASATAGTFFENQAEIYFDHNLPVVTNTVVAEVTITEEVSELAVSNGLLVYRYPVLAKCASSGRSQAHGKPDRR